MRVAQTLIWVCLSGSVACLRLVDQDALPCTADADCDSHEKCYRSTSKCVAADYCWSSADCDDDETCVANQCTKTQCTPKNEGMCAPYRCESSSGACKTSCASSNDCGQPLVCDASTCVQPECEGEQDLSCAEYACKHGLCLDACEGHQDCAEEHFCEEQQCIEGRGFNEECASDRECASGECRNGACTAPEGVTCGGTVKACDQRSEQDCEEPADGCRYSYVGECVGGTFDCSIYSSCPSGYCTLDMDTYACTGTDSCAAHGDESSCDFVRDLGCSWVGHACRGTAAPCGTHSPEACAGYPGCRTR